MVSELRTEAFCQGYDGCTRYSDILSMNHFSSVVDKACTVRCRRIWGGNTKPLLSSLKKKFFREEGFFLFYFIAKGNSKTSFARNEVS